MLFRDRKKSTPILQPYPDDVKLSSLEERAIAEKQLFLENQKEITNYICSVKWRFFVTLTFRYDVSKQCANVIFSKFIRRLNNKIYGRRSKKRLLVFPVMERNENGRIHFHVLFNGPSVNFKKLDTEYFKKTVHYIWKEMDPRTGIETRLKNSLSERRWFEVLPYCFNAKTVINYMLKQLPYNKNAVCWESANLPAFT